MMNREQAEILLREAEQRNSGPWIGHSKKVAVLAEKIAEASFFFSS